MNDRTRNFTVGVTTLAGVVGLGVLLFLFGYIPAFLRAGYTVTIDMADAVALNEGSAVQLYGIRIGQVRSIDFKSPPGSGVLVRARIRQGIDIPADAHAEIDTDLLGGTATVQIVPNHGSDGGYDTFLADDGTAMIPGKLGSLAGAFSQLNRLTNSFEQFSHEWRKVGENINVLLDEPPFVGIGLDGEPGPRRDSDVRAVLAGLNKRLDEIHGVLADIHQYTGDPKLREDVKATLANARQVSERAIKTTEQANALMTEAQKKIDAMATRYLALAEDTTATLNQVQSLLAVVQKGEGTAGRLLNDPALFENFADAALRISSLADEAKLLVQKWKAEGLPIQF